MKQTVSPNCPFCAAEAQELAFSESENFLAIYNLAPILPGHSLIIPRWHINSLLELSDAELCEMVIFARATVKVLLKTFAAKAFNWTVQEGEEAGQTVPHLHLHLIPRQVDDLPRPGDWYPLLKKSEAEVIDSDSRPRLNPDEMRRIVNRIRAVAAEMEANGAAGSGHLEDE